MLVTRLRRSRGAQIVSALVLTTTVVALMGSSTASANDCSDVTISGLDQFNKSLSVQTVSVNVPTGTYELIGTSFDPVHATPRRPQFAEVWSFTTDGGYTSPISPDLPDDQELMTFSLGTVTFDSAINSITFNHHSDGLTQNSVTPTLVFSCPAAAPTTEAPPTEAPPTTVGEVDSVTTVPTTTTTGDQSTQGDPGGGTGSGGELPRTGAESNSLALTGALFLASGAAVLVAVRLFQIRLAGQAG